MKSISFLYLSLVSISVFGQTGSPSYEIKLNLELSSEAADFAPRFADGSNIKLVFTSSRNGSNPGQTTIFYSELKDNKWQKPLSILDSDKKSGIGIITMDNKRNVMLFTKCPLDYTNDSGYVCNIYYSFLEGDMIGESIPLNIPIDLENIEGVVNLGHPCFSNEKDVLFFATNLPGGYGGKDIWFSKYERSTDTWSKPENAGAAINTSGDEMFPFIHPDGSLYFSSNGHNGIGGWDIYKAETTGELLWNDAQNLGKPMNSKADDFSIVFKGSSLSGYFASNRKKGLGSDDIYEFSITGEPQEDEPSPSSDSTVSLFESISAVLNKDECNDNKESFTIMDSRLYPNPNNGQFTLELTSNKKAKLKIRIHNNLGQILMTEDISVTNELFKKEYDFENTSTGIYYVQVLYGCEIVSITKMIIL